MKTEQLLGKLSIELIKKEDDKYSVALTSELNDTQIGVITEILYRAHKGEFEEKSRNLIDNIRYGTRFIDWFKEMESTYQSTMFRDHRSIDDLVRLTQEPIQLSFPFETADGCVCSF